VLAGLNPSRPEPIPRSGGGSLFGGDSDLFTFFALKDYRGALLMFFGYLNGLLWLELETLDCGQGFAFFYKHDASNLVNRKDFSFPIMG
jgi:hypothetical protein